MLKISVASGCYNEVENIEELYNRCLAVLKKFPEYDYEFVLEDNCSTDGTRDVLRKIAAKDPRFKVIMNANNFGHIRSPYNALLNATGDAVIWMCSDLQEPPEVLEEFILKWQQGYKVVAGVRSGTHASCFMEFLRKLYYRTLEKFSPEANVIHKFTGFGLYDKKVIEALKKFNEPYPYFRGLVSEVGFKRCEVPFVQDKRKHGETKNNFFTLYDMAMTGFVNHTKLPLRMAVFSGFFIAFLSILVALGYFVYKCCNWHSFQVGMAPLVIGLFFFSAVQLIFIGILGEYIGAIYTQVKNKPLVIEEERINFEHDEEK
ncbi:MAG: glycosyltransferase family 2 protein [Lentisphaeria bacterium]|nr:glycosyltransferase family 2 protein [Lentisphaeria bacterium]